MHHNPFVYLLTFIFKKRSVNVFILKLTNKLYLSVTRVHQPAMTIVLTHKELLKFRTIIALTSYYLAFGMDSKSK